MKATDIAVLAAAGGALALSAVVWFQTASRLASLESRAARLEGVPAPAPPQAPDLSRDLAALRADVEVLKHRPPTLVADGGNPKAGHDPAPPGLTPEQEEQRREAQAKQQKEWRDRQVKGLADSLEERLGLSVQQKESVSEILSRQYEAMTTTRLAASSLEKPKDTMEKAKTEANTEIRQILTPEQQIEYDKLVAQPAGVFGIPMLPGKTEGSSHK